MARRRRPSARPSSGSSRAPSSIDDGVVKPDHDHGDKPGGRLRRPGSRPESRMKAGIVIFPGINRERDMAIALRQSGGEPRMIWHKETDLSGVDLIVIPGGFSHGDYLRCGAM